MPTPPIQGSTLFLGDSITVGTPPFVQVVGGPKTMIAEVNRTADWLLQQVRVHEQALDVANVVMLVGSNDLGGSRDVSQIFADILATWSLVKRHGARLFAMTVPPVKGWANYASRFQAIEERRRKLNRLIASSSVPNMVIRLDERASDPSDPERLSPAYDSGDHLHLRKDALGALLQAEVAGAGFGPSPLTAPPSLLPYLVLGGIATAAVLLLARKRGYRYPLV